MKEPKTKPKAPPPKTMKRGIRTVKGINTSLTKTVDNLHNVNTVKNAVQKKVADDQQYSKAENYATDNVVEKGEYSARKVSGVTANQAKNATKNGYEKIKENYQAKKQYEYHNNFDTDTKNTQTKAKSQNQKHTKSKIQKTAKTKAQAQYQARQSTQNNIRDKKIKSDNASKIRYNSNKSTVNTATNSKRTIKISKNSIKQTERSVKSTQKTIKSAYITSKRAKQAAKSAYLSVKKASIVSAKVTKASIKAVTIAVKATITAINGLISAIAAGGWVVVIVILVAVIAAIISSPLGMFFNDTDGQTPTLSEVVKEINGEYTGTINSIIVDTGEVDEIIIDGQSDTSDYIVSNWMDVLAIFSVKSTMTDLQSEYLNVAIMDDKNSALLREVFWDMNQVTYEIIETEVPPEPTPEPTDELEEPEPEPIPQIIRTLVVDIQSKTFDETSEVYSFSQKQIDILNEITSSGYYPFYMEICGMNTYIGLTPEQLANLVNNLPAGTKGSQIVQFALSRLGHPYSQPKRGQGNYVDCSYLSRWCYRQAGVSHFTAGTAAEQARYCVDNGLTIAKSDLQAGDLVFWSHKFNGRFMQITHVGIYAGEGMVIDASFSRGMVVYRPLFDADKQVVYGRPHVK